MKGRMGLVVSLAAGVFAVIAIMLYLNAREKELLQQSALQDVVVTTKDVLENTPLDERMIQTIQVPRKYLQPGAIGKPGEVVGRVVAVPMPRGSQVTGQNLLAGGRESLAFNVPRGMRAVTLAVDDVTGVGGQLRAGNFIDVIGVFEYGVPSGTQGGQITYSQERTEAITIAQNVQIVSVGGESAPPPTSRLGGATEEGASAGGTATLLSVTSVTLLLTPAQVQELVLAQQIGALTLSLRSGIDSAPVDLQRLDENMFLKIPMPLKPRAQPAWREMRGSPGR
ncbi:MAG: Flp pilus assembly protein CpaB [Acidobacteria bacterium]|nr:Flp pilus assembly protein CpaB [Acidobacteriota bacterium]